jgi:hypothetical protein
MLSEKGLARKLANARDLKHSHPAGELAPKVTANLTIGKAGDVVRQRVSLPAGAAAGKENISLAGLKSLRCRGEGVLMAVTQVEFT